MKNIWISGYDAKIESIRKQHQILQKGYGFDNDEFEDDLPKFLKSITEEELETMIAKIDENIVMKDNCRCKFYTIHSYKGLEADNIRIAGDIFQFEDSNDNIYYVALTRGMKYILEDGVIKEECIVKQPNAALTKTMKTTLIPKVKTVIPKVKTVIPKVKTDSVSFALLLEGKSVEEISQIRNLSICTIYDHIVINIPHENISYDKFMTINEYNEIKDSMEKVDYTKLKNIKEILPENMPYDKIKIVRKLIYNI